MTTPIGCRCVLTRRIARPAGGARHLYRQVSAQEEAACGVDVRRLSHEGG